MHARTCALWCASLVCSAALGQADPGPPPPDHLPRVIFECEAAAGATFSTCSAWIWHGASYSALWSIGAIGQLTVSSAQGGEVRFERTDAAGIFPGLSGTYTGRFDGNGFSDGKATFSWKGASNTGAWTGLAEVTPVVHTNMGMVRTVTSDEFYGAGNLGPAPFYNFYSADLTAFAQYRGRSAGSSGASLIEDYRVDGAAPLKPGNRRELGLQSLLGIGADYEAGARYRPGMAIAAIYADGTTFGDSKVLAIMVERRRSMIVALTAIGSTLCELGTRHASVADVDAALAKQRAAENPQSPAARSGRDAAYDEMARSLHARNQHSASQAIARTWDRLEQLRSGLTDPVRNAAGELAIAAPAPLTCHLP